jgi:hypothetical protein
MLSRLPGGNDADDLFLFLIEEHVGYDQNPTPVTLADGDPTLFEIAETMIEDGDMEGIRKDLLCLVEPDAMLFEVG